MRIAIDTTPLQSGHKLRGVGSYTKLLFEGFRSYKSPHTFIFFQKGQQVPKEADLVHYPYFDPFYLTLPFIKSKPTVVTVHDLIPIAFPEHFPRGIRGEVKWWIQRYSLRQVNAVITDSIASKRDLVRFTGIDQGKIHVVYLAPAKVFLPVRNESILKTVKEKYGLPEVFVLYVGDLNWNKNIPGLIQAFASVKKQNLRTKICLVLVGQAFTNEDLDETQEVDHLLHDLNLQNEVRKLGLIPNEDLAAVYSLATVYVQPSFAEGFGLPVLEAMACGCPVVSSSTSSLLEIAGPAIKTDPYSIGDIAKKIEAILKLDNSKLKSMIDKESEWASKFTLEKTLANTLKVYEKVLA